MFLWLPGLTTKLLLINHVIKAELDIQGYYAQFIALTKGMQGRSGCEIRRIDREYTIPHGLFCQNGLHCKFNTTTD